MLLGFPLQSGWSVVENLHRLNVLATYRSLEKGRETRTSNTDGVGVAWEADPSSAFSVQYYTP